MEHKPNFKDQELVKVDMSFFGSDAGVLQPSIVINNSNNNNSGNTGIPMINGISQKSRIVYQLLAFFFGPLGIHNFYAGYGGRGAVQLLLTILSMGMVSAFVWIWAVIEIFVISVDSNNIPMR
jgi:TM2 domain-containing membrane protein YozV